MSITLTEYHSAVTDWIESNEYLSWIASVESYPELESPPTEISAYFGVTNWERAAEQPGTGEVAMVLSCQLLIVFPKATPNLHLNIREAVMSLSLELESQRFGLEAKAVVFSGAEPDYFNPELDECETWSVRWEHEIKISSVHSDLEATEITPSKVYLGLADDIGTGHEDDYEVIYESE